MPPRPPRCTKVKYPSRGAALAALRRMPPGRLESRAYRCGKHTRAWWHLTKHP